MRISIIAFLTLAALGGGELAARAIDPSAAPTEAQFREGTAEAQRAQREEDEVIGDNLTLNPPSLLFVAKSRSPLTKGGHGGTAPTKGGTRNMLKVGLVKGDLGGSRLDDKRRTAEAQREEDEVSLTSGTILQNGQDARSTRDELFCGTGILPVHHKLIENGATSLKNGAASVNNGQDARSTRDELFCGTGILPVHQKLIENGATSLKNGAASVKNGQDARSTRDELFGGTGMLAEVRAAQLSPRESPSLKSSHNKDFTSLLKTPATIAAQAEIPEAVNSNARQLGGTRQISQAGNAEGVYVAEVKIRFVNSRGEAVDKKGNPVEGRISEDFIRGELKLKAGDNYSREVVRSDLQQLQQLGLFDKVTVSIEEVGTDVNVIYNVQERSARSFSVSASLSDDVGVAVPLSYTDRTFGTTPQRLAVELEPSLRGIQYDVQFVSPYLAAEDRLGYSVRAFGDRRISEIFNKDIDLPNGNRVREIRMGGNLRFTRPLGDWQSTLGLNYTNISTRDRNLNIARRDELGNPLTFSGSGVDELYTVSFGAMLDRRDNPFNPTSGSILSLSTEQSIPLGRGNIVSNRLLANYIHYVPATLFGISESEALPEMLAFNLQAGTVIGDLPPTEAFRLGGRNSVRGYDSGDIGSGRSYFLASGEYRFPVGRDVGGVIFVDFASDLGTGDSVLGKPAVVRDKPGTGAGVGVGVRVRSSFGLIRLDMAVSDSGDIKLILGTKQRF
ncbi:BamA/TamA family outer membrane protein [Microcoleus sp. T3_B1]|uniref:BamA/TamA family outer membrane protein n=1 Tax=Microcoleus sp. T3_B1 TaxID=3055425 RepID=UPI002FD0D800